MNRQQMVIRDLLGTSNNFGIDLFASGTYSRPNSKKAFLELGAKIQANTLAFKVPEIRFENKQAQQLWDKLLRKNKLLEVFQQLESNLYKDGKYAIGITKLNDEEFDFELARIENYKIVHNRLVKLSIVVDAFENGSDNYQVIKEYDLIKNDAQPYIPIYAKHTLTKQKVSLASFKNHNFSYLNEVKANYIPWIVFKNNYLANSEIDDVDQSLFQILDNSLECMLRDNFWSNPFIFVVDNYNTDSATDVKNAIYKLENRVISTNTLANNSMGSPIEFHQGNSNTQNILQKIDKLIYLIKDQMFFKMNSADFGTKNMHNVEVENLNSNFNDYIEAKANSREDYYTDLINLFLQIINIESDFEVIVPGSTKYLKSNQAIYNVDQNGMLVNNNSNLQNFQNQQEETNSTNENEETVND